MIFVFKTDGHHTKESDVDIQTGTEGRETQERIQDPEHTCCYHQTTGHHSSKFQCPVTILHISRQKRRNEIRVKGDGRRNERRRKKKVEEKKQEGKTEGNEYEV